MVVFQDIHSSTKYWIKGTHFTLEALLGPTADRLSPLLLGGSIAVCRLAPQDYHRWHSPVSGSLGVRTSIDGALYTVNPIAVNRSDVFTVNKREVYEFHSLEEYGTMAMIAIGATMVGSINVEPTAPHPTSLIAYKPEEAASISKGDPHGYFAFGGSTIILLFPKGTVQFDDDLLQNSKAQIETIVRCNKKIGVFTM